MDVDAPTVTGTTWFERLSLESSSLSAENVKENPIILSKPRRAFSGVDVLKGNFFESAVVKVSGMSTHQLNEFDKKAAFVLYYENEDEANKSLLNSQLLEEIKNERRFAYENMLGMVHYHSPEQYDTMKQLNYEELFDLMVKEGILKIAIIISGQGPIAFGMPEMFTPMQHINANRKLKRLATLISDGRYSGVTYGAAIGHMTPEAKDRGGILYLQTGDLLYLNFREGNLQFLDQYSFQKGQIAFSFEGIKSTRHTLGKERLIRINKRQKLIAASNRLIAHTDAANGVVPIAVASDASLDYQQHVMFPKKVQQNN